MLRFGEVKPRGWIFNQMDGDLTEGVMGHFDEISPMASQMIFTENQADYEKPKPLRAPKTWWSGEVEANWMDALTRTALLTDNEQYLP